jgi:hypothetical protein
MNAEEYLKQYPVYYESNAVKEYGRLVAKDIKNYIMTELFNHRKKKEGLVSPQNMLCRDIAKHIDKKYLEGDEEE